MLESSDWPHSGPVMVSLGPCCDPGGVTSLCLLSNLLQERLLLSLLPAHIAMEMKAEIIQRLQGPKAGQMENTNNFHNLYVKRHTNVRYAAPSSLLREAGEPDATWRM